MRFSYWFVNPYKITFHDLTTGNIDEFIIYKNSLGLNINGLTNIFKQEYSELRLVLNLAPKYS